MADSYEGQQMIIVDQNGKLHDPDFDRVWFLADYEQLIVIVREIPNNENETSKGRPSAENSIILHHERLKRLEIRGEYQIQLSKKVFDVIESNKETIEELLLTNVLLSSYTILQLDRFPKLKRFSFQNKLESTNQLDNDKLFVASSTKLDNLESLTVSFHILHQIPDVVFSTHVFDTFEMTFSSSILNTNQDEAVIQSVNDRQIKEDHQIKEALKQFQDYKRVHWIPKARKVNTRRLTFTFDETMEEINEKYLPLDRKVNAFFNGQSLSYFNSESLKELNLFNSPKYSRLRIP